jgi:hypothetical protein
MNISRRETIIGVLTLFVILFGGTYWLGDTQIAEYRELSEEKVRLQREMQLNQKIIERQGSWTNRLAELQSQLPVYEPNISVDGIIQNHIGSIASKTGLNITDTRSDPEKQVGNLFELSIKCDWQGRLEAVVHFLHQVNEQGLRYDIRDLSIRPDTKNPDILHGDMTIDCAFRRSGETVPKN